LIFSKLEFYFDFLISKSICDKLVSNRRKWWKNSIYVCSWYM